MKYDAKAIGSGSEAAQAELQDKWKDVWCNWVFDSVIADTAYSIEFDSPRRTEISFGNT